MADRPIYFRDKKDELKGPFTEKQMQEWYRKGWFDSSFQIRIGDSGTFQSFESLRETNGVGCPFSTNVDSDVKLDELEKTAVHLKGQLSHAEELRARITVIENQLMSAPKSSSTDKTISNKGNSSTQATSKKLKVESNKKLTVKEEIDSLVLRICTTTTKLTLRAISPNPLSISQLEEIFDEELAEDYEFHDPKKSYRQNFVSASRDAGLRCGECGVVLWNPKQFILHMISRYHSVKLIPNCSMTEALREEFKEEIKLWKKEDQERIDDSKRIFERKFGSKSSNKQFRPTHEFMALLHRDADRIVPSKCTDTQRVRIYKSAEARQFLDRLHNHLLTGIPFCTRCQYLPIDINDYYRHMVTFDHWKRAMETQQFDHHLTILICNNHSEKYFM